MKRSPLVRKTPISKKRKPRAYKTARCDYRTPTGRMPCKQPAKHIGKCKKHADWYLDQLRANRIRKEHCEIEHRDERWVGTPFPCSGPIQDNHGIPRGKMRVRWLLENGLSGCAGVNIWAHQNKNDWIAYLIRHWGAEKFARIMELSVSGPLPDYEETERLLKA